MRAGTVTLRTLLLWTGVAVGLFLLWLLRGVFLLVFGALLLSMLLDMLAGLICRAVPLGRGGGIALATAIIIAIVAACLWLFGASIAAQFGSTVQRVKSGMKQLETLLAANGINPSLARGAFHFDGLVPNFFSYVLGLAEVTILLAIMAIYMAAEPWLYRKGAAKLFPARIRAEAMDALDLVGSSLRLWMLGQLILMLLVGVLSYVALLAVGIPNAGALALLAGVTEAIPYLGPFLGAVPAILVALSQGLAPALWTAGLYLLLHLIEGYGAGPLLQLWFVRIPPALILGSIFACQLLFGLAGVMLAAPLAVTVFAAVKVLYLRNTLHQAVELPKEIP
jgi:predicted PurR-regulated permease PerM